MSLGDVIPLLKTIQEFSTTPTRKPKPLVMICKDVGFLSLPLSLVSWSPPSSSGSGHTACLIVSQTHQAYSHLKPSTLALHCVWNVLPSDFSNITSLARSSVGFMRFHESWDSSQSLLHYWIFIFSVVLVTMWKWVVSLIIICLLHFSASFCRSRAFPGFFTTLPTMLRKWLALKTFDSCFGVSVLFLFLF